MKLNGFDLVDRGGRPSPTGQTALKVYFIKNGQLSDPHSIKDVAVFDRYYNQYPYSLLDSDGLLKDSTSSIVRAYFSASGEGVSYLDESEYVTGASGVYRVDTGEYVVVLNRTTSGFNSDWNQVIPTTASGIGNYLDVWTVKHSAESDYQTVINDFSLYSDTFISLGEPLLVKTDNKLSNKKIPLGSKEDLKITTTFTIENNNITDAVKNIIYDMGILNPQLKIEKHNEDPNLPARVEVSGYADTSGFINTTSDNTVIFNWDTEALKTHPKLQSGDLGNMRGVYIVTLKYNLLDQRIVTPQMYVQLV